jgi:hypothetical protein
VEVRAGRTRVTVRGEERAAIGLVSPALRLGLRTDF